jgi:hypothetical protein
MATTFTSAHKLPAARSKELPHRIRISTVMFLAAALFAGLTFVGFDYYRLDLAGRAESELHPLLRPSGTIGLRLGMLGVAMFFVIFLYPLRKRWRWLASIGSTRHWLDFHVFVGITAPIVITFHSTFKFQGLAGIAYWIMIAVALSGFVGRYLYAKIPRKLNAVQLDAGEVEAQARQLAIQLEQQVLIPSSSFAPLLRLPTKDQVRSMLLPALLWRMISLDVARPFQIRRLRSRVLFGRDRITTLGGFLKSGHPDVEEVIRSVRAQARLTTKMVFLHRVERSFHLWHVIHRPFSVCFVVLVFVHIGVALSMGYY